MQPAGLFQHLEIFDKTWTDIFIDFIKGLHTLQGYTVIIVVVDRLTKCAHFVHLKHLFTTSIITKDFLSHIIKLHRVLRSFTSDCGKLFVSAFWKALFQMQGTCLCMSSSCHPQTDGQSEVVNHTIEQYLHCFVHN